PDHDHTPDRVGHRLAHSAHPPLRPAHGLPARAGAVHPVRLLSRFVIPRRVAACGFASGAKPQAATLREVSDGYRQRRNATRSFFSSSDSFSLQNAASPRSEDGNTVLASGARCVLASGGCEPPVTRLTGG